MNLDDLEIVALFRLAGVALATAIMPIFATSVVRRAAFPDREKSQMQITASLRRRRCKQPRNRGVGTFHPFERQFGGCVGVLQRIDEFFRPRCFLGIVSIPTFAALGHGLAPCCEK